jgi:hypothetical protein
MAEGRNEEGAENEDRRRRSEYEPRTNGGKGSRHHRAIGSAPRVATPRKGDLSLTCVMTQAPRAAKPSLLHDRPLTRPICRVTEPSVGGRAVRVRRQRLHPFEDGRMASAGASKAGSGMYRFSRRGVVKESARAETQPVLQSLPPRHARWSGAQTSRSFLEPRPGRVISREAVVCSENPARPNLAQLGSPLPLIPRSLVRIRPGAHWRSGTRHDL